MSEKSASLIGSVTMYEFFEHTADLGLRIRAPKLETLFAVVSDTAKAASVTSTNVGVGAEDDRNCDGIKRPYGGRTIFGL